MTAEEQRWPNRGAVSLAADGNDEYVRGLAVAVNSLLSHLDGAWSVDLYVLDGGISPRARERLLATLRPWRNRVAVSWITLPLAELELMPTNAGFPPSAYARMWLPDLLPTEIGRVLYLDADTLVLRDVSRLLSLDLDGQPLAAVPDVMIPTTDHPQSGAIDTPRKPYFNSGVLLVDLSVWRGTDFAGRARSYAASHHEQLKWPDQDVLNAVAETWHELPLSWNVQSGSLTYPPEAYSGSSLRHHLHAWRLHKHAHIVHFTGPNPWSPVCNSRATAKWVVALLRSRWYTRAEALRWLATWSYRRVAFGFGARSRRILRGLSARNR